MVVSSVLVIAAPLVLLLFPISVLKIVFFPFWVAFSQLTILVIEQTAWDEWISRAVALAIYSISSISLIGWVGSLIFPPKFIFKKECRVPIMVVGCVIYVAMSFITRDMYFNPITGVPLKKAYENKDGKIEFFPLEMNYHPVTGEMLSLVTKEIVDRHYKVQNDQPQPPIKPQSRPAPPLQTPVQKPPEKAELEVIIESSSDVKNFQLAIDDKVVWNSHFFTSTGKIFSLSNKFKSSPGTHDILLNGYTLSEKHPFEHHFTYTSPNASHDTLKYSVNASGIVKAEFNGKPR